jgi:hypothetical protein
MDCRPAGIKAPGVLRLQAMHWLFSDLIIGPATRLPALELTRLLAPVCAALAAHAGPGCGCCDAIQP